MRRYNPKAIEPKWQKKWQQDKIYQATENPDKPKRYVLEYFPYPSGAAMHVGHVRNYTIGDTTARFRRMNGDNVLHPMGWDAFGLPAENYAIKTGISPQQAIKENTDKFRQQLMQMGFGYDWSREIDSSDPKYYRWTQWLFLLLNKKGLAYQKESLQWWCPHDKTVLANEQVENGLCWRCGNTVEKKSLKQWFFKITDYADRLEQDLENLNWSDAIKSMQRNWIGRSVGAEVEFAVRGSTEKITVYTTRIDTLFSGAFIVLAPEHELVKNITAQKQLADVEAYVKESEAKSDLQRQESGDKDKTGVFTGTYAINPANNEEIPIWIGDFVLGGYGTGAVFGDIHDERDFEFIKKFDIPAKVSVVPEDNAEAKKVINKETCFTGEGVLINSGKFDGLSSSEAREKITNWLGGKKKAKEKVNYKIRDWLISRQRYWGAPIPIIHCAKCGTVPVPEKDLPVVLPEMKSYEPSGDGRSPLARVPEFVNTTCPECGDKAERETDTMDGFACSSWYFLRFADPHNDEVAFDKKKADFWLPVDDYIGGAEHAVMHLLYARFWTKVMYDEKLINFDEPFTTLRNHGMILAPDGRKMSKSWGNVVAPDDLIEQGYGADSVRLMELFIGPWNQSANWSVEGMGGTFRFLQRVWTLVQEYLDDKSTKPVDNQAELINKLKLTTNITIKKVTEDVNSLSFNTAISALMEMTNEMYKIKQDLPFFGASGSWKESISVLLQLLAPFAPHITEELWLEIGQKNSIHTSQWPGWVESIVSKRRITIAIQVNGKLRGTFDLVPESNSEQEIIATASKHPNVVPHTDKKKILKTIYVPGKLVNFVVKA